MKRARAMAALAAALRRSPVVALLGPRQAGKTTLADATAERLRPRPSRVSRFDLEDPVDLARLTNPRLALEGLDGLVLIDEVQRRPELFPLLRVLVDRGPKSRRFLILGSASGDLLRQSSESLAGRVAFQELTPFTHFEAPDLQRLWLRGGFPRAYLSRTDAVALAWTRDYVSTFLERDIPAFGLRVPAVALRRFWMMIAHYHGQILNHSEIGRALGVTDKTVRHYLDVLTQTFMVRLLQPWSENIAKRQVRSPKLYLRDSGLLHVLLGIASREELMVHPKVGASWEGFALESVIRELGLRSEECFFWATHAHAELDLLTFVGGKRVGFEFKSADAPTVTKSMRIALTDLHLDHLFVVFPGALEFPLEDRIDAIGFERLRDPKAVWRGKLPPLVGRGH